MCGGIGVNLGYFAGAPVFTVQQNDIMLTSFDFNITSPVLMPSCISSYTYTATST